MDVEEGLETLKELVLVDIQVIKEYIENLDEDNPFTLEGLATLSAIGHLCEGTVENIHTVASCKIAQKNKAINKVLLRVEDGFGKKKNEGEYYA